VNTSKIKKLLKLLFGNTQPNILPDNPAIIKIIRPYQNFATLVLLLLLLVQVYLVVLAHASLNTISNSNIFTKMEASKQNINLLSEQSKLENTEKSEQLLTQPNALEAQAIHLEERTTNAYQLLKKLVGIWDFIFSSLDEDNMTIKNSLLIEKAEFVLQILGYFFLPLLYSLLGTVSLVLKVLIYKLSSQTIPEINHFGYRVCLLLGTFSGLVMNLLLIQVLSFPYTSLFPLAIAFLVGYIFGRLWLWKDFWSKTE